MCVFQMPVRQRKETLFIWIFLDLYCPFYKRMNSRLVSVVKCECKHFAVARMIVWESTVTTLAVSVQHWGGHDVGYLWQSFHWAESGPVPLHGKMVHLFFPHSLSLSPVLSPLSLSSGAGFFFFRGEGAVETVHANKM